MARTLCPNEPMDQTTVLTINYRCTYIQNKRPVYEKWFSANCVEAIVIRRAEGERRGVSPTWASAPKNRSDSPVTWEKPSVLMEEAHVGLTPTLAFGSVISKLHGTKIELLSTTLAENLKNDEQELAFKRECKTVFPAHRDGLGSPSYSAITSSSATSLPFSFKDLAPA